MWMSAKELTNELIGENIPTFLRMLEYPRRETRVVLDAP
jgi:hypothetical protein